MIYSRRRALLTMGAMVALPTFARAASNGHSGVVFAQDGRAIRGIDPVGYFTNAAATPGSEKFQTEWMGVKWCFANAANREAFEMNPRAYAPQYGGYCAFAASKGAAASTEPDAWTIVDGRLFLNYSLNVRGLWQQDIPGNVEKADANWPDIMKALMG